MSSNRAYIYEHTLYEHTLVVRKMGYFKMDIEKRSKKAWKYDRKNNPVKKDLFSGKYKNKVRPGKRDDGPNLREEMKNYDHSS